MQAFHNDQKIKDKYIIRLKSHAEADNIIQSTGWEDGKGCAVGCTLENYNHKQYPLELGIPEWLAHVEDRLFEGLSNEEAKKFPLEFLAAINVGADLEKIKPKFLIMVLESTLDTFDHVKHPAVKKCIDTVIGLYKEGCTDLEKFKAAARSSRSAAAARSFRSAYAAYAAYAVYAASDAAAASYAAYAAAAAASATDAAASATAAAYATAYAYATNAAYADREKIYKHFSDELLKMLREQK